MRRHQRRRRRWCLWRWRRRRWWCPFSFWEQQQQQRLFVWVMTCTKLQITWCTNTAARCTAHTAQRSTNKYLSSSLRSPAHSVCLFCCFSIFIFLFYIGVIWVDRALTEVLNVVHIWFTNKHIHKIINCDETIEREHTAYALCSNQVDESSQMNTKNIAKFYKVHNGNDEIYFGFCVPRTLYVLTCFSIFSVTPLWHQCCVLSAAPLLRILQWAVDSRINGKIWDREKIVRK